MSENSNRPGRPAVTAQIEASSRGPIRFDDSAPDVVVRANNSRFQRETQLIGAMLAVVMLGVFVTWGGWDKETLAYDDDLIYDLGLIGGLMMLGQFLYTMRKHVPGMRRWGPIKQWFNVHMAIGIVAPLIILIHTRFTLQSINGSVAFFSMLMVVLSGIVGRYLLSKVNFDYVAERASLKHVHERFMQDVLQHSTAIAPALEQSLKMFTIYAMATPSSLINATFRLIAVGWYGRIALRQLAAILMGGGAMNRQAMAHEMNNLGYQMSILRNYVQVLIRVARYNAYKKIFAFWRVGHVPVIYLLLLSGLAHVLAVHMY
ncbi:MAG: hypothetical protein OEW08_07775 [Gammaproteobacteria bacterium]|nr:hypothetical protein [Gammaproteobacteria bacterium]